MKNEMQNSFVVVLVALVVLITVFQGKSFAEEKKDKETTVVEKTTNSDLKKNLNGENKNQVDNKIKQANKVDPSSSIKKTVESDTENKSIEDKKNKKIAEVQSTATELKKKLTDDSSSDKKTN